MSMNCPNCGAPRSSWKCEYCGTVFEEPETVTLYADNRALETVVRNLENQKMIEDLYRNVITAIRGYGSGY